MKKPKRTHCDIYKCPKCEGYGITFTAEDCTSALFQCSLCGSRCHMAGLPKRTQAIRARWIRKNREARLRNKISKLSEALKDAGKTDDFWRNYYKHYQNDRLLKRSIFIKECGTFGQDVEGS